MWGDGIMTDGRPQDGAAPRFRLRAWAGWLPGAEDRQGDGTADVAPLPALLRRRVTPPGRRVLDAAWAVLSRGPSARPRLVLSSRHGEYDRTLGLLRALAESDEVSPADFSLAVHHGLAGLLSIATGNRGGHVAVAAGADSFGAGCLEAVAALGESDAADGVLLLHVDAPLPAAYDAVGGGPEADLALALWLAPAQGGDAGPCFDLSVAAGDAAPAAPLVPSFVRLLQGEADAVTARGDRLTWSWRRVA